MNLEAQVVEKPSETNKPTEKKKTSSTEPKLKKAKVEKKGKKGKDSNKPKRPPTAFFLFMDDFRIKEANPNSKDIKALEADSTEDAEEEAGSEKEAPEKEVQEVEELSDEE